MDESIAADVCEGDFPPQEYGSTLAAIEATCQQVVERVFRDDAGFIRGGVHARTMKPLTAAQVPDRPFGRGGGKERAAMPPELKPVWLNYEDACMASGRYLVAMAEKYRVTQDPATAEDARHTFQAIRTLWQNAAGKYDSNPALGWLPKPYGGIEDVSGIRETSPDQYCDVTLGLHSFYQHIATSQEKESVETMVTSFADWWIDHDYTIEYLGNCMRCHHQKRVHFTASFLYLTALAYRFRPVRKYKESFEFWLECSDGLFSHKFCASHPDVAGQAVDAAARLPDLAPEHSPCWRRAVEVGAEDVAGCLIITGNRVKQKILDPTKRELKHKLAHYLSVAHELLPDRGYGEKARLALRSACNREHFYNLARGQQLDEMGDQGRGSNCRDVFYATSHAAWLCGYWILRRLGLVARDD